MNGNVKQAACGVRASCLFKLSLVVSISGDVGTVLAAVVLDYVS